MILMEGFCVGLRGEEIVKTMATDLRAFAKAGANNRKNPHVCFPLRGRFKGEKGERNHMLVCAYETKSGLRVGQWVDRFLSCFEEMGRSETGFLFVDSARKVRKIGEYDPQFIERLEEIQSQRPELFPPGINIAEDYSLVRSLRRGSTTLARVRKIPQDVIDLNNRWRKIEAAMGRQPSLPMMQLYSEIMLMLVPKLEYSALF